MTSHELTREDAKTLPYWQGADVRMSAAQADEISEGDTITLDGETATVTGIERFTARFKGRNLQQALIKTDAPEPVTEQTSGWTPNRYVGTCYFRFNDESATYEVFEDGTAYESIHAAGTICVCQHETSEGFDCAVFFAGAGGSTSGDLRLFGDGDTHEIDGITYEASSTRGWVEVE